MGGCAETGTPAPVPASRPLAAAPPAFLFPPGALTLNRKSTWNFKFILETFRSLQRAKFSNIFLQFLDLLTGFELKTILPPVAVSVAFLSIALTLIQLYTFNFIE